MNKTTKKRNEYKGENSVKYKKAIERNSSAIIRGATTQEIFVE
jgi:hypothetical protein|tara:strand:+ start:827 stop:955 length:129 start_codon:yes stop_codon:yes gene_type:complete